MLCFPSFSAFAPQASIILALLMARNFSGHILCLALGCPDITAKLCITIAPLLVSNLCNLVACKWYQVWYCGCMRLYAHAAWVMGLDWQTGFRWVQLCLLSGSTIFTATLINCHKITQKKMDKNEQKTSKLKPKFNKRVTIKNDWSEKIELWMTKLMKMLPLCCCADESIVHSWVIT